jgi:hypothetical protein
MKRAKPNRRAATPIEQREKCPVLPIALRVGELWDAYIRAQENHLRRDARRWRSRPADPLLGLHVQSFYHD